MQRSYKRLAASVLLACSFAVHAHEYKLGAIEIDHPWARATPPAAKTGGVFMKLDNHGEQPDALLSASAPTLADKVEIHNHILDNGVARMRPVARVDLPAQGGVMLKPGSYHIMLMGLKAPLQQGQKLPLTLRFERAGEVKVEVKIEPLDADAEAMHKH